MTAAARLITILVVIAALTTAAPFVVREFDSDVRTIRSLGSPVTVTDAQHFYDGGSIALTLTGPGGDALVCRVDRSLPSAPRRLAESGHLGSYGRVCIGDPHLTSPDARFLEGGSYAEALLLSVINRASSPPIQKDWGTLDVEGYRTRFLWYVDLQPVGGPPPASSIHSSVDGKKDVLLERHLLWEEKQSRG